MARREMNTVCRLCLGQKVQLLHVFEALATPGWTPADAIRELLVMQVSARDVYPKFICAGCMGKLVDFKQFKNQCEINKDSLDLEYGTNGEVGDNEVVVGMVMCGNENQSDIFLKEEDAEVPVEKDPLDLSEERIHVKSEIEDTFDDYNEVPSAEVFSSADQASIQKWELEDQIRTEDCNELNTTRNTSSEAMTSNEEIPVVVGMVLCGNENQSDIFLKEEDAEVPVEKDPLDLSEERIHVKSEIEDTFDDYNEVPSAEVFSSADQASIQKWELEDQIRTEDCNELNTTRNTSSEAMTSNEEIPASEAELAPRVYYNTRISKRKKDSSYMKDNVINAHSSCPENNRGPIHTSSICGMENCSGNEQNATESHPTSSNTTTKPISHSEEEQLHSEIFGMALRQKRNRKMGMMDQSDESRFTCSECNESYFNKINLSRHIMRIHSAERPFKCHECSKSFSHNITLVRHLRIHSGEKPFNCTQCSKSFSQKTTLVRHLRIHSGERPFKCNMCSKTFSYKSLLNEHLRIHSGERPFKCDQCSKSFTHNINLVRHLRFHSGEKPFECTQCSKSFSQKSTLVGHLRIHSGERPFKCKICSKTFSRKSHLNEHLRIHSGERPFKCTQCSKSFSQKITLVRHLRIHSRDRSIKCKICSKTFSRKSNLNEHLRIHSGERPFKCDQCSKSFSHNINLVRHLRIHSGEKPFECTQCSKSFSQKSTLVQHLRIHSGERPFKCEICSKTFSSKSYLITHLRVHSGERLFK